MAPERHPHPDRQDLRLRYLTGQREIKVANQLTLNRDIILL